MAKPEIFISYDYDNDRHYKNVLLVWDKNQEFDFAFNDQSADVSIQSTNAEVIKRAISAKLDSATDFLCIIGSRTSRSSWEGVGHRKGKGTEEDARCDENSFG